VESAVLHAAYGVMQQPADHHLAEFNFGTLKYDWDDSRLQGFLDGLDLVNGLAAQAAGFVWRLSDTEMEAEQTNPDGALGGNPRVASTLSVWESVAALENFVWKTVHRQFYQRKTEWYDAAGNGNFVMWWLPAGQRPTVAEGMARWSHSQTHGHSDHAFGWAYLKAAQAWKTHGCAGTAAR
jgi:hypothetical protein